MSIPQPNSLKCFVCGVENPFGLHLKFYMTAPGEVTADVTISEQYQGYPGVVHGGIVASILDEISGRAWMGDSDSPRFMYTARLEVKYRKNTPVGKPLKLVGRKGQDKGRIAVATGALYDDQGTLLAECESLLVDVPQSVVDSTDLESLGWKVYPEQELGQ